jgi:CheY-like chemotaxis protein
MTPHVLVVEDDHDFRAELEQLLEADGFEVRSASNGAEAIDLLESGSKPRMLILDLLMPGIVGQELLDYLQSRDDLRKIPVVIISGAPDLAPTGYPVFKKPLDVNALRAYVLSASA